MIFGVPCGNRDVQGRDLQVAPWAIQFIKQTIVMDNSVARNLKVAERFIGRDISEESSKIEKNCFQIAIVIFVMAYLLAPYKKLFGWQLLGRCRLQSDYENNASTIHLFGCHLFSQVYERTESDVLNPLSLN